MNIDVSIILVTYNSKDLVCDCITSIYEKTHDVSYEIIVVDNDSKDGVVETLNSKFSDVTVIANGKNLGFGAANNVGAEVAKGHYLLFLNSDTLLENNAIKILHDFLKNKENKHIAACGGGLINRDGSYSASYSNFRTFTSTFLNLSKLNILLPRKVSPIVSAVENNRNECHQVDYVAGADIFIRKEIFNNAGRFDDNFFLYFEEADLSQRIKKMGYDLVVNTEARIVHLEGKSTDNVPNPAIAQIFEDSHYNYFVKHHGRVYALAIKVICTLNAIAFLMIHLLRGKFHKAHYIRLKSILSARKFG